MKTFKFYLWKIRSLYKVVVMLQTLFFMLSAAMNTFKMVQKYLLNMKIEWPLRQDCSGLINPFLAHLEENSRLNFDYATNERTDKVVDKLTHKIYRTPGAVFSFVVLENKVSAPTGSMFFF